MRITNTMMTNRIMNSLLKNKRILGTLEEQLATGKKIQKPSDDPIVAVRALKLRSSVREVEQYSSNIKDAQSWMGVTEQAFKNMTEILKRARDLLVQNASETLTVEDRKTITDELEQLKQQLASEGNVSYAGRYVFTGYKTDTPLVYTKDTADQYEITEHFTSKDIETVDRVITGPPAQKISVQRIRLAYGDIDSALTANITGPSTTVYPITTMSSTDANAYDPTTAGNSIHFLKDTGELIFNSTVVGDFPANLDFTYQKNDFKKNDINPQHYFDCTDLNTGIVYTTPTDKIQYQVSYNQNMTVNTLGKDVLTVDLLRDFDELIDMVKNIPDGDSLEKTLKEDVLSDLINDSLDKFDAHIDNALNQYSSVGTGMKRLELTLNRLEDDKVNFTELMSENEDVDIAEVIMQLQSQEMVYQAALMSSGKIIQPTLLEFLR